jgi:hypothetical protein
MQQRHLVAKRGETGREIAAEFCLPVSLSYVKGSLTCRNMLRCGSKAVLPLRKKSCYGVLSALEILLSRLGLNPRTLDPVASTITITPPRTTRRQVGKHSGLNFKKCYALRYIRLKGGVENRLLIQFCSKMRIEGIRIKILSELCPASWRTRFTSYLLITISIINLILSTKLIIRCSFCSH